MTRLFNTFLSNAVLMVSLCGLSSVSAGAVSEDQVKLGRIKAQLFYEETGRFSKDIMQSKDFSLWNTCVGEGSAEEIANDLFVSIELTSKAGQYISTPMHYVANDENGSVIEERTFSSILITDSGSAWKGVWLKDVGCGGTVNMTVTFGKSSMHGKLDFAGM